MRRSSKVVAGFLIVIWGVTSPVAGSGGPYAGRRLADVLADFQRQGLEIIYSSALVRPTMVVASEPAAGSPREALDEILAAFGLAVTEAVGGRLVVVPANEDELARRTGSVQGIVLGNVAWDGVVAVASRPGGRRLTVTVSRDGTFAFTELEPGHYTIELTGHEILSTRTEDVEVRADQSTEVRIPVTSRRVLLEEIVVTPSHYALLESSPTTRQFLSREDIQKMPHLADDLFRAVRRLPGTAGGDYSASFNIRGGNPDEVLILLDGLELYEPFHFKDFQNLFSIVDSEAVGGVELMTGGFPAEYGDRMSGVMNITMPPPSPTTHTALSLGTLNGRLLSSGPLTTGRGGWHVSARGWYPDLVLDATGSVSDEIVSDYYDVLARVLLPLGDRSTVATNFLAAYDRLAFSSVDIDETEEVTARYLSHHLWSNLLTQWSDRLSSQTVVAAGRVRRERRGGVDDVFEGTLAVRDDRTFAFIGLRQDWTWSVTPDHVLKWGAEARAQEADYDYFLDSSEVTDAGRAMLRSEAPAIVRLQEEGTSVGAYLSDRFRLGADLVIEAGMRWDRQDWLDEAQLSPRLNVMYAVSPRTTLRAAWGRFHQSQRLNELQVEDGVDRFLPAQRSEHWLAAVEYQLASGVELRLEAYSKELSRLRPRYENIFNPLELFPEARDDRVLVEAGSGRSRGIEVLLKRDREGDAAWWIAYTLAQAEERVDGRWVPLSWDQRHAVDLGVDLPLGRGWNLNLAGSYHSGWPTTSATGEVVDGDDGEEVELTYGPRNGERFDPYVRVDMRAAKQLPVRFGELLLIIEVINFTNHHNPCCVEDFTTAVRGDGTVVVRREEATWAPIVPSMSLSWRF